MPAEDYLKNGKFSVAPDTYSILRTTKSISNAFANVITAEEITVIIKDSDSSPASPSSLANAHSLLVDDILAIDSGWRIITFEMKLDFSLVGFLAIIASKLAEYDISIFVISSFSTDHILVKDIRINDAIIALQSLGLIKIEF